MWVYVCLVQRRDKVPECGRRCLTSLCKVHQFKRLAAAVCSVNIYKEAPVLHSEMSCSYPLLCTCENISIYVQRYRGTYGNATQARMNQGLGTGPFWLRNTGMHEYRGWMKTLRGAVLALVCYTCVYVWKMLNPPCEQSHPIHVRKRLMRSSVRSHFSNAKHADTNKLYTGPFIPRSTCSHEHPLTLGAPKKTTLPCIKNLRRVILWQSRSVKICSRIQSNKTQKACWAEISESFPRRLNITWLHLLIAPKLNGFECANHIS